MKRKLTVSVRFAFGESVGLRELNVRGLDLLDGAGLRARHFHKVHAAAN